MTSLLAYLVNIFDWVVSTSIMAAILVLLILTVKGVFKSQLGAKAHYLIWVLVLIRLVLPWSFQTPFSIFNLIAQDIRVENKLQDSNFKGFYILENQNKAIPEQEKLNKEALNNSQSSKQLGDYLSVKNTIAFVWLLGACLFGGFILTQNRQFAKKINKSPRVLDAETLEIFEKCRKHLSVTRGIPLIESNQLFSPTLYGLIKPKLLLPAGYREVFSAKELDYIFLHELAHYKRKDILVNWMMSILLVFHWFNPVLWYAYSKMREDQEVACDAFTLSYLKHEEKTNYGYTLIKLLENYQSFRQLPNVASILGSDSQLKRRISMIKIFKTNSFKLSLIGLMTVFLLGCVALTNANTKTEGGAFAQKNFYLQDQQYKIDLPEGWEIHERSQDDLELKLGEETIGGMFLVGYYDKNDQGALPNHSEIIKTMKVDSKFGQGNLHILKRSDPAVNGQQKEWFEIYVIIPTQFDKGLAYSLWFQAPTERERVNMPSDALISNIKKVVGSMEMTAGKRPKEAFRYIDPTYGYAFTIPANWEKGKYVIETFDKGLKVQYLSKEQPEMQAFIFSINVRNKKEWEAEKGLPGAGTKIGEDKNLVFVFNLPLDNPFLGNEQKEYGNMVTEAKKLLIETFTTRNYLNQTYGYSIVLPAHWDGKYEIKEKDYATWFMYKSKLNPELKGEIFVLTVYPIKEWEQIKNEPGRGREIKRNEKYVYSYRTAFDNPYQGKELTEYGKMTEEVKNVVQTLIYVK